MISYYLWEFSNAIIMLAYWRGAQLIWFLDTSGLWHVFLFATERQCWGNVQYSIFKHSHVRNGSQLVATTFFGSIKARHNVKLEVYQGFLSVPGWSDQLNFHVNIVVFNKPWGFKSWMWVCLGRTSTGNLWKGFIISGLSRTISLNIRSQHVFFVINHTDSCGRGALLQTGFLIIHCRPCAFWRRCQTPAKMMLTLCWVTLLDDKKVPLSDAKCRTYIIAGWGYPLVNIAFIVKSSMGQIPWPC